jgi:hypothetical protein
MRPGWLAQAAFFFFALLLRIPSAINRSPLTAHRSPLTAHRSTTLSSRAQQDRSLANDPAQSSDLQFARTTGSKRIRCNFA